MPAATLAGSDSLTHRPTVGLVLSGGGAKGIAHAGVIQALEENGVAIDFVAGTSMGAIVGGLYSAGYTPDEIVDLILSDEFSNWSTGKIDPALTYYYLKPQKSPAVVKFNIGKGDSTSLTSLLPSSLISPIPMNFGFVEMFAPHTAVCQNDFDKLFVPFRCVASDVYNKRKVVLSKGNLGDAIRMSMTFPAVFKPIEKDGLPMFDGGIYDNFPVSVMKEDFAPDVIIGVDVSTGEKPDVTNLISQLESMIIQQDDYSLPEKDGIKLHVDCKDYGLLDFPKAKEIAKRGYDLTISMIDSIKKRTGPGVDPKSIALRRDIYKCKVQTVKFDSLIVEGTNRQTEKYMRHMFFEHPGDTVDIAKAKDVYYQMITSGKFRDLVLEPEFKPDSRLFTLRMKASVKNDIGLGIGGYITSSTNSLAFVSANYETLDLNSFSGEIKGWVGQSYYGGLLNARMLIQSGLPTSFNVQAAAFRQNYYEDDAFFFESDHPSYLTEKEFYVKAGLGIGIGRHAKLNATVGYGYLNPHFYTQGGLIGNIRETQNEGRYKLGKVGVTYDFNTLDNEVYPSRGSRIVVNAAGVLGSERYVNNILPEYTTDYSRVKWAEIELDMQKYFVLSNRFSLGMRLDALASTKKLYENYLASIAQAPAFAPTQSSKGLFIPSFRANSFVAGGVMPVFKLLDNMLLRLEVYGFSPMRTIEKNFDGSPRYGDWFGNVDVMGEASLVYNFSFASLSLYGNYFNAPESNWSVGVSFGFYITAPKFLR